MISKKLSHLFAKRNLKKVIVLSPAGYVQFHCYDYIPGPALRQASFSSRIVWLEAELPVSYCVKFVNTYEVNKYEEALNLHTEGFLANGYEGSILRLDKPYECKRSYNLQKFKDFHDTEATIIGYEAGKGKFTGLIGKFLMQDDDGIEFGCPIGKGYNFDDRRNILNNVHDYIGKRATFTYFERTKANSYRHPLYKTLRNYE